MAEEPKKDIHESHKMVVSVPMKPIRECEDCWACECHAKDRLAEPCIPRQRWFADLN